MFLVSLPQRPYFVMNEAYNKPLIITLKSVAEEYANKFGGSVVRITNNVTAYIDFYNYPVLGEK